MSEAIGLIAQLNDAQFQAGVARYLQGVSKMEATSDRGAGVMNRALGSIGGTLQHVGEIAAGVLIAGGIQKMFDLGASAAQVGIEFDAMKEQSQIAFETMLGSGEKAKVFLDDLQKFAAATPFEFPELVDASKKLVAFGVDTKDILPTLSKLGDLSAGVGVPVSELADLYGKAKVQGRLFAQDINQLTGRGIPIIQELAKQFGVSEGEVMKLVEAGKVGFPQLEKAVTSLTAKGSKFGGLMDKQSKSFKGLWSTVSDTYTQLSGKIMQPFFDLMSDGLQMIVDFTSTPEFTKWIDDLTGGVSNFIQTGFLPFLKNTWAFINTSLIPTIGILVDLIGDIVSQGGDLGVFADDIRELTGIDLTGIVEGLRGVTKWIGDLAGEIQKGDWGAVWNTLVSGLQNAWTATIQPTLAGWATKFWTWLTDPSEGALAKAGGNFNEVRDGITNWLKDHGPETWAQLTGWATDFWNWATGPDGAILKAGTEIQKIAVRIGTGLGDEWTNTVSPALEEWGTQFWDWLTADGGALDQATDAVSKASDAFVLATQSEEAKTKNKNAGYFMGVDIMNGIGDAFANKDLQIKTNNKFIDSLNEMLKDNAAASRAWFKAGEEWLDAMIAGMKDTFTIKWIPVIQAAIDAVIVILRERLAEAVAGGVIDGMKMFGIPLPQVTAPIAPTGGASPLGTAGLIGGGSTVPASNAFAGATAAAQMQIMTTPVSLVVTVGGQEIQNATAAWSYAAVTGAVNDAVSQVNGGAP